MVQVAASLLFVIACGYALIVLVGMIRTNADPILSALCGEGAFPVGHGPVDAPAAYQPALILRRPMRQVRTARMMPPPSLDDIRRAAA